jgi:general secretion pathway protein G
MRFRSKAGKPKLRNPKICNRGFTLIEMVVVISLILVLISIALPMYNQTILRAKEAKLRQNLATLNKVVREYSLDKRHAPQALDDLVPGYLRSIPDDITGSNTTWQTDQEEPENCLDPNNCGIGTVRSGSNEMSSDGTGAYSTWTY